MIGYKIICKTCKVFKVTHSIAYSWHSQYHYMDRRLIWGLDYSMLDIYPESEFRKFVDLHKDHDVLAFDKNCDIKMVGRDLHIEWGSNQIIVEDYRDYEKIE